MVPVTENGSLKCISLALSTPNLVKLDRLLHGGMTKGCWFYEFMPRGSLDNHLFEEPCSLPWKLRDEIALEALEGLAFLHEEAERPDYNVKLSDFGLAKDGPREIRPCRLLWNLWVCSPRIPGDRLCLAFVRQLIFSPDLLSNSEFVMAVALYLTSRSDVYSFVCDLY
ncbi:hypothetical protein Leryth_019866 [Lithospermum erythrorhizon]|nr:hypothetical protein Leryth_019866 [Lithospermum erythrorhizon]